MIAPRQLAPHYLAGQAAPPVYLFGGPQSVAIAAAAGDGENQLARFLMQAYNGGPLLGIQGYPYPVVCDLDSLRFAQQRPVFREHDRSRPVGHTDTIEVKAYRLAASGVVSCVGQDAFEISASSKNGFPWQSSIGVRPGRVGFVSAGEVVRVNERVFRGPVYVVRGGSLVEISFVSVGGDITSSAQILAAQPNPFPTPYGPSPIAAALPWFHASRDPRCAGLRAA